MGVDRAGVAVVGSISVDLTAYASPLPRPGETVLADFAMGLGGKGANQAIAACRAGAPTTMIGVVGDDTFGRLALDALVAEGVHTGTVSVIDGATGVAHIRVDSATGQNDIAVSPQANAALTADRAEQALRAVADRVGVVLVQLETPLDTVRRVAELCLDLELALILDPAPAQPLPEAVWAGVAVVTPNETEAAVLTGSPVTDPVSAVTAGRWFLNRGVGVAVITLGARGAVVVRSDGSDVCVPFSVAAVDTTAAGDAFSGTLAASLATGRSWDVALDRALAAGALATTIRGASVSLPTAAEVDRLLTTDRPQG